MGEYLELSRIAREIRRMALTMITEANMGHPGGSLSQADLLTALYFKILNIRPEQPDWPERDRFVLTKGHTCASFYATLALKGFFPIDDLKYFGDLDSHLQSHPDRRKTPGVEVSSGALGQGLSVAVGMALAAKMKGHKYSVYTLMGDGECDSGQVWEAVMAAAHYRLDNLIVMIDHNKLQAKGTCATIMNLEPLPAKWQAFNWLVSEIDGHNFGEIISGLTDAKAKSLEKKLPSVIIANTIKGKGVSFMENVCRWHNAPPNNLELQAALAELRGTDHE